MKKIVILLILIVLFIPIYTNASVQVLNLNDTLKSEGIIPYNNEYKEEDGQITIYLFRGAGCTHCHDFLEFLNSIASEYGYMFRLRSYELYYNKDNVVVKDKVANYFGKTVKGVPYIVIGKDTFYGYSDKDSEAILKAIKKQYESKNKYDVFDHLNEAVKEQSDTKEYTEKKNILFIIPIVLSIIIMVILFFTKKGK